MIAIEDVETIKKLSTDQLRSRITDLGADWNPAEKKIDLATRLVQLQGTPDVADKIRKQLADAGFAKEDRPIYKPQARMTKEQMSKIVKPYVEQGVQFKVSKDGETWAMRFDTGRVEKYDGESFPVISRDSGSTTIPPKVLEQCAQLLVATKKRPKVKKLKADEVFEEEEEAA